MKSIFKRQKLFFISLVGIIITSSFLVFSYAYQKVKVDYLDSSKTGMTVSVGKLDVSFTTTNRINISNMSLMNDYKTANYTEFTIDNTKSTKDIFYRIKLSSMEYSNSLVTEDFKYTLVEAKDNKDSVIGSGDFKFLSGTEYIICFNKSMGNHIEQGKTKTLKLYLWLKETDKNQNDLENANFKGKIEINSYLSNEATKLALSNLRIYGNSIQDVTPTVENPVEIKSLGETSRNLIGLWESGTINFETGLPQDNDDCIRTPDYIPVSSTIEYNISKDTVNGKFRFYDSNKNYIGYTTKSGEVLYTNTNLTFYPPMNAAYMKLTIDKSDLNYDCQLEEGYDSTDYVSYRYIDIVSSGKNLIEFPYYYSSSERFGINNDGSIDVNVENPASTYASLIIKNDGVLPAGNYTYTCGNENVILVFYYKNNLNANTWMTFKSGQTLSITSDIKYIKMYFQINPNKTVHQTIYPQLEEGSTSTNYEPYQIPVTTTIDLTGHEPLRKIGDVADYIDFSSGKLVRKIGVIDKYNGESINSDYISNTGELSTDAKVYYILDQDVVEDIDTSMLSQIYNDYYINVSSNIMPYKIEYSI